MKFKLLFLLALSMLARPSAAQVLVIKGKVKNSSDQTIEGYYELRNSCKQLALGHCSKMKLKLELNEVYTLTFSKPGYQSKSIVISTYADSTWWHLFRFDVLLKRMNIATGMESEIIAGSVFYDPALSDYNYIIHTKENHNNTNKKQGNSKNRIRPALKLSEHASAQN